MTITEALAELKTIQKRLEKKRQFVAQYLVRQEMIRDPLDKEGGSVEAIKRERQGIKDLEERIIAIRAGIAKANETTKITIGDTTRSISDWLAWRRDVAPGTQQFLTTLRNGITNLREQQRKQGVTVGQSSEVQKPQDIIVNINEVHLAEEIESLEERLGKLDGQLSLKNATVEINL